MTTVSYTLRCQGSDAGFSFVPPAVLSKRPSSVGSYPGATLAGTQAEFTMEDFCFMEHSFEGWALMAFRELAALHAGCSACAPAQCCPTALLLGQWTAIRNQTEWVPLRGFEERYEITKEGLIRRIATGVIRKWVFPSGPTQYPSVQIWKNNKHHNLLVHIMVAETFLDPRPTPLHIVNHKDGNKTNPHVDNLEWATWSENMLHAWRTGLRSLSTNWAHGEAHPNSTISATKVQQMRLRREDGISYPALGREFGVHTSTARRICVGTSRRNG